MVRSTGRADRRNEAWSAQRSEEITRRCSKNKHNEMTRRRNSVSLSRRWDTVPGVGVNGRVETVIVRLLENVEVKN
jgi:hypothetical protein